FSTYDELWQWSVKYPAAFWESIWRYFNDKSYCPYRQVMSDDDMPETCWFEGATLNYAEHLCRDKADDQTAIIFQSERHALQRISWEDLKKQTASVQACLKGLGVQA